MLGSWALDWFVYLTIATVGVAFVAFLIGQSRNRD